MVLVVIASVKFTHGAWIVIVAIPIIVIGMLGIRRHYLGVADRLRLVGEPADAYLESGIRVWRATLAGPPSAPSNMPR